MAMFETIYLASASPRRKELLTQLGVNFKQIANDFDETQLVDEAAEDYVKRLALGKAQSAYQQQKLIHQGNMWPVLGSDTIVVLDGQCLGKPKDKQDAAQMLGQLSGKANQVLTAVCLYHENKQQVLLSKSEVKFCELSKSQIELYCETGEPLDKAGSYAIQGLAASFVEYIRGSYTGIVGLPLFETRQLLEQQAVRYSLNRNEES